MTGSAKDTEKNARPPLAERMRALLNEDAFAAAGAGTAHALSLVQTEAIRRADERGQAKIAIVSGIVLFMVFVASLFVGGYEVEGFFFNPGDVLATYAYHFNTTIMPLFDASYTGQNLWAIQQAYAVDGNLDGLIMSRLGKTVLSLLAGLVLAVSGMLFQSCFRNPLAAPTTLGAADGVSVGYFIFMLLGFMSYTDNVPVFFLCVYGAGVLVLVFVILLSKHITGPKNFTVFDMLLVGTVLAQFLGSFITFQTNYFMGYDQYEAFYDMQNAIGIETEPMIYVFTIIILLLTLVPTYLLRFRLNLISFPDADAKMLGADPGRLRFLALALGSVMIIGSMVAVGQVAMVSLAVPYLSRYIFGAEFRRQFLGNVFLGAIVLLVCQDVASCIVWGSVPMPVGTVVSLVVMPFFVWVMALGRRSWE